jgi:hypothetical protein
LNDRSPTPPTPIRRDISRAPQPLPRANLNSNSSHYVEEENERIYLNQLDCQSSTVDIIEPHQYASIDPDDSTPNEQVYQ